MEKLQELKALIETAEKEGNLFYDKGNKAAGTRLRNALQQIKTVATDLRKDVTEKKNAVKKQALFNALYCLNSPVGFPSGLFSINSTTVIDHMSRTRIDFRLYFAPMISAA